MIYVIVKESGEFADFSSKNVYATMFRSKAEKKLAELQKRAELARQANSEIMSIREEWNANNPAPLYPVGRLSDQNLVWLNSRGWVHPDIIAHEMREKEHQIRWCAAQEQKTKELAMKYGITENEVEDGYDEPMFSIQSVDGD
jgi:hypothetical protein